MSSYFSSFTTSSAISNLGTRLTSLRRAITSGEESDDSDNEDCSHISNVLRAYYTERGRPFPPWLPPDPKGPAPAPARVIATTQLPPQGYGQAPGPSMGKVATSAIPGNNGSGGGGGGLSDLWGDSDTSSSSSPQPTLAQTSSLRRGRGAGGAHSTPMSPGPLSPGGVARPLPSQRAGSYQSRQGRPVLDSGPSAQERLRARLHGGRSPSSSSTQSAPQGYAGGGGYSDPSARKPVGSSSGGRLWGSR